MSLFDEWIVSASDADRDRALERAGGVLPKHRSQPRRADDFAALRDRLEREIEWRSHIRELDEMCREDAEWMARIPTVTKAPMTVAEGLAILDEVFAAEDLKDDEKSQEEAREWAERAMMEIEADL